MPSLNWVCIQTLTTDIQCFKVLVETKNGKNRYLSVTSSGLSWGIGDSEDGSDFFVSSVSAVGGCPACPSNARNSFRKRNSWQYRHGKKWTDSIIKISCSTHMENTQEVVEEYLQHQRQKEVRRARRQDKGVRRRVRCQEDCRECRRNLCKGMLTCFYAPIRCLKYLGKGMLFCFCAPFLCLGYLGKGMLACFCEPCVGYLCVGCLLCAGIGLTAFKCCYCCVRCCCCC